MNLNLLSPVRKMNDEEREMWVENDESLYNAWRRSRLSKRTFVRTNRATISRYISDRLNS